MKAYISLGSNLGDRGGLIRQALARLEDAGSGEFRVTAVSALRETEPWGVARQPRFLNAVAEVETWIGPEALLMKLRRVEREFGRVRGRRARRWGPRSLDLDLLLYGNRIVRTRTLRVPHPRMCRRRFVLEPLAELAPRRVIPGDGRTVRRALLEVCT